MKKYWIFMMVLGFALSANTAFAGSLSPKCPIDKQNIIFLQNELTQAEASETKDCDLAAMSALAPTICDVKAASLTTEVTTLDKTISSLNSQITNLETQLWSAQAKIKQLL